MKKRNIKNIIGMFSFIIISEVHTINSDLSVNKSLLNNSYEEVINKAQSFPLHNVLNRFKKEHDINDETAVIYEKELKRFLIVAALNPKEPVGMFSKEVDDLWHIFITYTKDYSNFCNLVAGRFMHHIPKEEDSLHDNPKLNYEMFKNLYEKIFQEEPNAEIWRKGESSRCMECSGGNCSWCNEE